MWICGSRVRIPFFAPIFKSPYLQNPVNTGFFVYRYLPSCPVPARGVHATPPTHPIEPPLSWARASVSAQPPAHPLSPALTPPHSPCKVPVLLAASIPAKPLLSLNRPLEALLPLFRPPIRSCGCRNLHDSPFLPPFSYCSYLNT